MKSGMLTVAGCGWRHGFAVVLGMLALAVCAAVSGAPGNSVSDWPDTALPPGAEPYAIGEQLNVNGLPMRLRGFSTTSSPALTAAWFRDHLPRPLMENRAGDRLVLGRASGNYYITVQLSPQGAGTNGLVAVTDVRASLGGRATTRAANDKLLSALPSGTQVLNSMTSIDAGRNATFVVLANTYSEDANRERLQQMLRRDGYELERESRAADAGAAALAALPRGAAGGRTMFFSGKRREAVAVISRMPDNRVVIVLNTITSIETSK
jgi:hypothetical protein